MGGKQNNEAALESMTTVISANQNLNHCEVCGRHGRELQEDDKKVALWMCKKLFPLWGAARKKTQVLVWKFKTGMLEAGIMDCLDIYQLLDIKWVVSKLGIVREKAWSRQDVYVIYQGYLILAQLGTTHGTTAWHPGCIQASPGSSPTVWLQPVACGPPTTCVGASCMWFLPPPPTPLLPYHCVSCSEGT